MGYHFLLQWMKVKSESEVAQSCPTLSDPMDCSPPGSPIHGISRHEYWSGVPLPSLSHDLELPVFSSSLYLLSSLLLLFLLLISMSVCLSPTLTSQCQPQSQQSFLPSLRYSSAEHLPGDTQYLIEKSIRTNRKTKRMHLTVGVLS